MGTEYFCDCRFGIKGKLCKHTMGLVYLLETSFTIAPTLNPLKFVGRKRGKGRPALVAPALDKRLPKNIRIMDTQRDIQDDEQEDVVKVHIEHIENSEQIEVQNENSVELENPVLNSKEINVLDEGSLDNLHPNISTLVSSCPLPTIPTQICE